MWRGGKTVATRVRLRRLLHRGKHSNRQCRYHLRVIWFFERRGQFLRLETRDGSEPGLYELVITDPDGCERVEQFDDSELLLQRQRELDHYLASDGWHGPHGRFL